MLVGNDICSPLPEASYILARHGTFWEHCESFNKGHIGINNSISGHKSSHKM